VGKRIALRGKGTSSIADRCEVIGLCGCLKLGGTPPGHRSTGSDGKATSRVASCSRQFVRLRPCGLRNFGQPDSQLFLTRGRT
jgi:hypothetical protein